MPDARTRSRTPAQCILGRLKVRRPSQQSGSKTEAQSGGCVLRFFFLLDGLALIDSITPQHAWVRSAHHPPSSIAILRSIDFSLSWRAKRTLPCLHPQLPTSHLHCIWTLPEGDADFSIRRAKIKRRMSRKNAARSLANRTYRRRETSGRKQDCGNGGSGTQKNLAGRFPGRQSRRQWS